MGRSVIVSATLTVLYLVIITIYLLYADGLIWIWLLYYRDMFILMEEAKLCVLMSLLDLIRRNGEAWVQEEAKERAQRGPKFPEKAGYFLIQGSVARICRELWRTQICVVINLIKQKWWKGVVSTNFGLGLILRWRLPVKILLKITFIYFEYLVKT